MKKSLDVQRVRPYYEGMMNTATSYLDSATIASLSDAHISAYLRECAAWRETDDGPRYDATAAALQAEINRRAVRKLGR